MNLLKSWTVSEFVTCCGIMSPMSAFRWVMSRRSGRSDGRLTLHLVSPVNATVQIRCGSSDFDTLREVCIKRVYDRAMSIVPDASVVVDLGSNIGLATLLFAQKLKDARIVAVEPCAENFALLQGNLAPLINEGRCRALNAAIWDCEGQVRIGVPSGAGGFKAYDGAAVMSAIDAGAAVRSVTMSALMHECGIDHIDLLKVDIEGAECELLRSARQWLSQVRAIAIEFHGTSRCDSGFDALVDEFGFRVVDEGGHTVIAVREQ